MAEGKAIPGPLHRAARLPMGESRLRCRPSTFPGGNAFRADFPEASYWREGLALVHGRLLSCRIRTRLFRLDTFEVQFSSNIPRLVLPIPNRH
jgi:hypothetical protein